MRSVQSLRNPAAAGIGSVMVLLMSFSSSEWIVRRLGAPKDKVEEAMNRLIDLNLVEIKGTSFKQCSPPRRVRSPVAAKAIQSYHEKTLRTAIDTLETVPVEQREFNALTMGISSSNLSAAKQLTARYLENIHSLLDKSEDKDSVYTIAVQIFPVSRD